MLSPLENNSGDMIATGAVSTDRRRIALLCVAVIGLTIVWAATRICGCGSEEKARRRASETTLRQLAEGLEDFRRGAARYPTEREGIAALVDRPPGLTGEWRQSFRGVPKDCWGRPFVYRLGSDEAVTLYSLGPDGNDGSADDVELSPEPDVRHGVEHRAMGK